MRHVLTAVALCAATLVTTACTGSEEPSAPPSPEAALTTERATSKPDETETTTAPPSPDKSTATSVGDGPPELPAEATEQTEAGAKAAFSHFISVFNHGVREPQFGTLPSLSSPTCILCLAWEQKLSALVKDGTFYTEDILSIDSNSISTTGSEASGTVTLTEHFPIVLSADGETLLSQSDSSQYSANVEMVFVDEQWIVSDIVIDE